jgi:hypothetical protein
MLANTRRNPVPCNFAAACQKAEHVAPQDPILETRCQIPKHTAIGIDLLEMMQLEKITLDEYQLLNFGVKGWRPQSSQMHPVGDDQSPDTAVEYQGLNKDVRL